MAKPAKTNLEIVINLLENGTYGQIKSRLSNGVFSDSNKFTFGGGSKDDKREMNKILTIIGSDSYKYTARNNNLDKKIHNIQSKNQGKENWQINVLIMNLAQKFVIRTLKKGKKNEIKNLFTDKNIARTVISLVHMEDFQKKVKKILQKADKQYLDYISQLVLEEVKFSVRTEVDELKNFLECGLISKEDFFKLRQSNHKKGQKRRMDNVLSNKLTKILKKIEGVESKKDLTYERDSDEMRTLILLVESEGMENITKLIQYIRDNPSLYDNYHLKKNFNYSPSEFLAKSLIDIKNKQHSGNKHQSHKLKISVSAAYIEFISKYNYQDEYEEKDDVEFYTEEECSLSLKTEYQDSKTDLNNGSKQTPKTSISNIYNNYSFTNDSQLIPPNLK